MYLPFEICRRTITITRKYSISIISPNPCINIFLQKKTSYNPCYSFSEKPLCNNVAACQSKYILFINLILHSFVCLLVYKDGSISFPLGFNSFVTWSISNNGNTSIVYSTDSRELTVNLICSQELDKLYVNGELEPRKFSFTLSSKCACWNQCIPYGTSSLSSISIVSLFLCLLVHSWFSYSFIQY
jgi:hypothetical protein